MADYRPGDFLESVGMRPLSHAYRASYQNSAAIDMEHLVDAERVLRVMKNMPGFFEWLRGRTRIEALDVGSGEGIKSELIANELLGKLRPEKFVLGFVDSDSAMLDTAQSRLASRPIPSMEYHFYPMTLEFLIRLWPQLGLLPDYVTLFHMLYYLPQQDDPAQPFYGTIPLLTDLMKTHPEAPYFIVTEGPGQLQNLKWFMRLEYGFGNPVGEHTVVKTLKREEIPFTPPVHVPNKWRVNMDELPAIMFHNDFEFLLDGNWNCPPVTDEHRQAAGEWIQKNARADGDGFYLDGPDAIIVAGKWLERQV